MGKVTFDMSMSLDGFITGPNDGVELPLGEGGERLHEWMTGKVARAPQLEGGIVNRDTDNLNEAMRNAGAMVMGKRMFDVGESPWGDNPPFHVPIFVVTHHARATLVKDGGTTFTFVTNGIESALQQAKAAAGDKDVSVAGGANVIQQCLNAGQLDEIQVHLVPVLLGDGVRLFEHLGVNHIELESTRVIDAEGVTHLRFRVIK